MTSSLYLEVDVSRDMVGLVSCVYCTTLPSLQQLQRDQLCYVHNVAVLQWNPSIAATLGGNKILANTVESLLTATPEPRSQNEQFVCTKQPLNKGHPYIMAKMLFPKGDRYRGVPLFRGSFVHKLFIWDLGSWPLYRGGLYSGVAIKRGSTVKL